MDLNLRIGNNDQRFNRPTIHRDRMSERDMKKILVAIFGKERVAEAKNNDSM